MSQQHKKYRRKKKLGSYPIASVVISISLALFFIGIFGLIFIHANQLKKSIQENLEIQIYLKKGLSVNDRAKIRNTLAEKPYISNADETPRISFISREDAAKQMIKDTGEDFVNFLGENPLRDAFIINIKSDFQNKAALGKIKAEIVQLKGVFEVVYIESLVESINNNLKKVSIALIGIAILLFVTVIILIHNTIKLALFSQRFLIRSMQLVGATTAFIRRPFLLRSVAYGFLGGIVAAIILAVITKVAYDKIEDLSTLFNYEQSLILLGILITIGIAVSFFSTFYAIKKYLRLSLDELY